MVDASVMPERTRANTNATIMMIGERVADADLGGAVEARYRLPARDLASVSQSEGYTCIGGRHLEYRLDTRAFMDMRST